MHLEICLLGPYVIVLNGEQITRFELAKAGALLAYLAAEAGKPQLRYSLAGLLWPDYPEQSANQSLRQALYSLRKVLHEDKSPALYLLADRSHITFDPDHFSKIDTLELDRCLGQAAANPSSKDFIEKLELAVSQVNGEFLEGFLLDDCPAFEEWILNRREYHNRQIMKAHDILCHWYEVNEAYEQAVKHARRQLELEPLQEAASQQLMRLLAKQGKRTEALQVYEHLKHELKESLDLSPSQATNVYFEQIKKGEFDQSASFNTNGLESGYKKKPRHNLPLELTSFIGREAEIEAVIALLREHRLVTLTGVGGTGKTRLALRTAETVLEDYPDGVSFVELASLADPELVSRTIITALGLQESTQLKPLDQLISYFRRKQFLLMLDNCEHVIEESARVTYDLLKSCPGLKIMATSREALGVTGEFAYPVPSMPFLNPGKLPPLEQLNQNPSIQLFAERARAIKPDFTVTVDNAQAVAQVCKRLDGIPLAIELAAARVNAFSPAQIAERLDDRFRLLTGGARTAVLRQQTLRACFDWSYVHLDEKERLLLMRLSVFQGGWNLELAIEVCGFDGLDEYDVINGLAQLVNQSIIATENISNGSTRFRSLETIRRYAHEKLLESGKSDTVCDRHIDAILNLTQSAESHLRSHGYIEWLDRLQVELDNIRVALTWALDRKVGKGLQLATSLYLFWNNRDHIIEGKKWLVQFQEKVNKSNGDVSSDFLAESKARRAMIQMLISGGPEKESYHIAEEAYALAEKTGNKRIQAVALMAMGWQSDSIQRREKFALQCLTIAEEIGDHLLINQSIINLTNIESNKTKIKAYFERSLKSTQDSGDQNGLFASQLYLGKYYSDICEYTQALLMYEQALKTAQSSRFRSGLAFVNSYLGELHYARGKLDQAVESYNQLREIAEDYGLPEWIYQSHLSLGYINALVGELGKAQNYFEQAVETAIESHQTFWLAQSQLGQAEVAWFLGEIEKAVQFYREVVLTTSQKDDASFEGLCAYASGMQTLLKKNISSSEKFFFQALKIYSKSVWQANIADCLNALVLGAIFDERFEIAVRLHGAAISCKGWRVGKLGISRFIKQKVEDSLKGVPELLGKHRYDKFLQEGQAVPVENVVAYVQEVLGV